MKFKWDKKYLYWGITAFCVIVACIAFFQLTSQWGAFLFLLSSVASVLSPFICGFIIAYILNDVLMFFERSIFLPLSRRIIKNNPKKSARLARLLSVAVTHLLLLGLISGLLVLILPELYRSIVGLVEKSSTYLKIALDWLGGIEFSNPEIVKIAEKWLSTATNGITDWIKTGVLPQMTTLIESVAGGVFSIIKGVFNFVLGWVISIYIMCSKETLMAQGKKGLYGTLKPKTANKIMDELNFVDTAFGNYIAGEIIDSLIVTVATYLFMVIAGMPYAALISLIIGITNLIPIFGPFIGAIPSGLLILLENPMQCLIFAIFILVMQQLDGNVIKPMVHSSKSGLSGFWIMFAILFFGGLFGIWGMLIGVPVLSVIYNILQRRSAKRLKARGLPVTTEEFKTIHRISPETNEPIFKEEVPAPKFSDLGMKAPFRRKKKDDSSEDK